MNLTNPVNQMPHSRKLKQGHSYYTTQSPNQNQRGEKKKRWTGDGYCKQIFIPQTQEANARPDVPKYSRTNQVPITESRPQRKKKLLPTLLSVQNSH